VSVGNPGFFQYEQAFFIAQTLGLNKKMKEKQIVEKNKK
jgi:hypothetical protein